MTHPCSKEADIATLKANATWQNRKLEKIEANTDALVLRLNSHDIKWARLGVYAFIAGGMASALFQIVLVFAK